MRIERLDLDGFGRFAARSWDLPAGLTVMLGPNEAGKTTLLNALRALLFGFEASRDGRAWYPALAGGRRGGRLILTTAAGERWTVERHGERGGVGSLIVRAPNGNTGGQETLDRILGGADRELFTNIFAFGLGELQSIQSLSGEGVRSRIYGAGTGLGGMSAADLERQLRAQQETTFRPHGRTQELNQLVVRIDELGAVITTLERAPARFEALNAELLAVEEERGRLTDARARSAARATRSAQLVDAAGPAARLAALEAELAAGDASLDALPPDLDRTLAERLAERGAAREAAEASGAAVAALEARLAATAVDEPLLAEAADISALADERALHAARAEQIGEVTASATASRDELEALARRAGGDVAWLLGLDDSVATLEALREVEARQVALSAARDRLLARLQAHDTDAASDTTDDEPLEAATIADRWAALRALVDLRIASAGAPAATFPRWAWAAAVAALAALVVGLLLAATAPPLVPVAAPLAAVAGAAFGWLLAPRATSVAAPVATDRAALLAAAGLPLGASDVDVARAADDLAVARARLTLRERSAAAQASRRASHAAMERELRDADADVAVAQAAWETWLTDRGLPGTAAPAAARQVVELAAAARRADAAHRAAQDRQATLVAACTSFDRRLDELLARLRRPSITRAELRPAALQGLVDALTATRDADRRREELRLRLDDGRRDAGPTTGRLAEREAAIAALLAAHGAADTDALEGRATRAAERRLRSAEARVLRAELAGIAGGEMRLPELLVEASATDLPTAQAAREAAEREVAEIDEAAHALSGRAGELRSELAQLEHAEELGQRRQELSVAVGRATAAARAWTVRALALRFLEETRHRYERERQPQVIQDAERYLERITDGAYGRIVATPGEATVRAEAVDGTLRQTDELSRGTVEQLYLALRFGLIEQFSRTAEPLPVVMDDILVNFDAERAGRAASAVRSLAEGHQVLYFTCHPWTAALLDPDGARTAVLD